MIPTDRVRMYAPPESLADKPHTVQGDVYALGVLLYQVVVGDLSRPVGVGWERDVKDELLRQDIAACVDFDPARRLSSATELADRLDRLDARRGQPRPQESPQRTVGSFSAGPPTPLQLAIRLVCGDQNEESTHTLGEGQSIKIGRSPQADVVVRSTQVSRLHCEVGVESGRLVVRDTKSSAGTYVAGEKISDPRRCATASISRSGRRWFTSSAKRWRCR